MQSKDFLLPVVTMLELSPPSRRDLGNPTRLPMHMTALLDLPHSTSHQTSLRSFYDTLLETNIGALEAPAKSQDTFADLLVPVIWAKLPEESKRNLARSQQVDYRTI